MKFLKVFEEHQYFLIQVIITKANLLYSTTLHVPKNWTPFRLRVTFEAFISRHKPIIHLLYANCKVILELRGGSYFLGRSN